MHEKPQIPALTGLRGVAALLVVVAHYQFSCSPYPIDSQPVWLRETLDHSAFAMSLFFALSGFVIAYNYAGLDWGTAPVASVARFSWARFSRLYPAYLLFIVMTLGSGGPSSWWWNMIHILGAQSWVLAGPSSWWWNMIHILGAQSWLPAKFNGTTVDRGIFNVSWSISTELALYVLFMLAALVAARSRAMAIVVGIACLVAWTAGLRLAPPHLGEAMTEPEMRHWISYISPLSRLLEFGGGAVAALFILRWPTILDFPMLRLIMRPLEWRPLIFAGEISYSLYLFHVATPDPMLFSGYAAFSWSAFPLLLANMLLRTALSLAVAYGLWCLVELPAKRWLRTVRWRKRSPLRQAAE